MAGDDDPNRRQDHTTSNSRTWPDDDNPFVAFRRFADEQISSMLQSVIGLPTNISPPPPDHWAIFENDAKYQRPQFHHRQNGNENEGQNALSAGQEHESDKKTEGDNSSLEKSRWSEYNDESRRMQHHRQGRYPYDLSDIDLFFDSFFDRFWFDDRFSNRFFHPYHRPMFSSMVNDDSPAWPVYYLMFSPYSPLHLERQAHYRSHRERGVFSSIMSSLQPSSERDPAEPQWREAFEDLLRLENGKPMLDRQPTDVTKEESGRDWLQGLAKRGSLGDRWKYMSGSEGKPWSTIIYDTSAASKENANGEDGDGGNNKVRISWNENDQGSTTELDVYDRFLADIESREREFFKGVHESPLLRLLFDDRRTSRGGGENTRNEPGGGKMDEWLEPVPEDEQKSAKEPSVDPNPSLAVEAASKTSPAEQTPYVISTSTSTQRIRLADGSVETKTTRTKRFSDGREERNESVQVDNPQNGSQESSGSDQGKNGWFWKGD